ncbi:MAG TPA: 3-methyl-2-oxobutanoate hydroxymethyltransferase [Pseudogracilibacillus sp.]|nr:3-methyl-2-oxobutanoate hydroxymethyltransferase [Pseudogracilibacillus sp.]
MLMNRDFLKMKKNDDKVVMLTSYDYPSAKQAEEADVDMILVGDSLGMVVLGYDSTTEVTINDMIHHAKAVRRGAPNTYMVVDMPFMSYHGSIDQSVDNARKVFQKSNAQALKLEGASREILELTRRLTDGGIPIVGHIGLTPQTFNVLGGYRLQGNDAETSNKLVEQAKLYEENGAQALVLECIPKELSEIITNELSIPVIGIGAGLDCDGQVLVYHDILQYGVDRLPKFVKTYADFNKEGLNGIKSYVQDVRNKTFPTEPYTYKMKNIEDLPKK